MQALQASSEPPLSPRSTRLEKEKWMHDLNGAIDAAKGSGDTALALPGSATRAAPRGELGPGPWGPHPLVSRVTAGPRSEGAVQAAPGGRGGLVRFCSACS